MAVSRGQADEEAIEFLWAQFKVLGGVVAVLAVPVAALIGGQASAAPSDPVARQVSQLVPVLAILSGILGVSLIILPQVIGALARAVPGLLLLFVPGFFGMLVGVAFLIPAQAGLLLMVLYLAGGGRTIFPFLQLSVGLTGVLGTLGALKAIVSALSFPSGEVTAPGVLLDPKSQPRFWPQLAALAKRVGTKPPRQVLAGLDPTFFVTEATVVNFSGRTTGRTLYISLPLLRVLTEEEAWSIIAHELGHFRGGDTKFTRIFYPVYRGTLEVAARIGGGIASIPALGIISLFLDAFATAERAMSRKRELKADAVASSALGPATIACALVKVHAFLGVWRLVGSGRVSGPNASLFLARAIAERSTPSALVGVGNARVQHPLDTHPPLDQRLKSLGLELDDVAEAALRTVPDRSLADSLDALDQMERVLTEAYSRARIW